VYYPVATRPRKGTERNVWQREGEGEKEKERRRDGGVPEEEQKRASPP
jgi:hypothetical protein